MKIGFLTKIFARKSCNATKNCQTVIAEYLSKNQNAKLKQPFCEQFWQNVDFNKFRQCKYTGSVKHHEHLNSVNYHLMTTYVVEDINKNIFGVGITPMEMIKRTDTEFKILPKLQNDLHVYRCVHEKPDSFQEYHRYIKSLNVKKGDVIMMPEYAYATSDINYAKTYLRGKGIIYDIEIPQGSRVSKIGYGINNEIVFPRSSRFECVGTEQQGESLLVKLKYVKPIDMVT